MSGERPIADSAARQRIRTDLDRTFVVEAAAGTGKTTELVARIVAVLRAGASLDAVVAVTFTEKAAGEMKLRLRQKVEKERSLAGEASPERRSLDAALEKLEAARIGTIHSFCADLLRERPVEARIDPAFEVVAEDEARRLFEQVFERWFQEALAAPGEGVRRVLRRRSRGRDDGGPRDLLEDAGWQLVGHRDFTAPWRREPFDRDRAIDALLIEIEAAAALADSALDRRDWLAQSLSEVRRFSDDIRHREAVRGRDHDGLEADLRDFLRPRGKKHWNWKGSGRWFADGLERHEALARRDALKASVERLVDAADADLAAVLREELRPLCDRYRERKERAGKLDFLDLLVRARDLVRDDRAVREELQRRFRHLFVDEFQDTDPLQAEILVLLAGCDPDESDWRRVRPVPGKLFVVGDPKQSIYRFRRADIVLYEEAKRILVDAGAEVLFLTTSFRGAPAIQVATNAAFAPLMDPGPQSRQARYVALEAHRPAIAGQPVVIALPVPRPYSDFGRVTKWAVEKSVPDAIAALVDWLVRESKFEVSEKQGEALKLVPLEARHVCLLFKQFQSFGNDATRRYVDALEARQLPHVLVGGRSFHDREEIEALRIAVQAIEWPDDELAVFATLRGPFLALHDEALLAFRHAHGSLHPLKRLDRDTLSPAVAEVADALGVLGRLHRRRNRRPIADTIADLLETTRAHAGIAIWPTGEQALANLLRMMDLARRFESAGATSFRAFADRLGRDAVRGDVAEAPVVEEGTDGVRIMTVHRAKGLEFPVVILADPTTNAVRETPTRFVDPERGLWAEPLAHSSPIELLENRGEALARDEEEAVRLAYVATTRARDILVVPVVGDERLPGWVDVLHPVLYPPGDRRRQPASWERGGELGEDSVFERPEQCRAGVASSVKPGIHRPEAGAHDVLWWSPFALKLDREHAVGLRQQQILQADDGGTVSEESVRAHAEWHARRDAALVRGAVPARVVRTVTEMAIAAGAGGGGAAAAGISVESTTAPRLGRPHGKRFGSLVHALLAEVDLAADRAAVAGVAELQGRLIGATAEEIAAAAAAGWAALSHPLLRRAARALQRGECRRETPILVRGEHGVLVEGVIDLAFREAKGGGGGTAAAWTVVDFKTDVEIDSGRAVYEAQVAIYAQGIAAATGEPASGVLLLV